MFRKLFISLILFALFLSASFAFEDGTIIDWVTNTENGTISSSSDDVNKDKLKVKIWEDISLETWFGNQSWNWDSWTTITSAIITYVSVIVILFWTVATLSIVWTLVFYSGDQNKSAALKSLLIKVIIWLFFYWFLASSFYVAILKYGQSIWVSNQSSYTKDVIDLNSEFKPSLLRD